MGTRGLRFVKIASAQLFLVPLLGFLNHFLSVFLLRDFNYTPHREIQTPLEDYHHDCKTRLSLILQQPALVAMTSRGLMGARKPPKVPNGLMV